MIHIPVMLKEVVENLNIVEGGTYVDCTFGGGGYTKAILERAECKVVAIDQDPSTAKFCDILKKDHGERLCYINANFRNLAESIDGFMPVDGVVYDLGVSSMQLDDASRGFSFQGNSRLDMRMSQEGRSACDFINESTETEIADTIYYYGGEHSAKRIAKKIVEERSVSPIITTFQLASIVRSVCKKSGKIDPATKTFQAIRIAINDELTALQESLSQLQNLLKISGRVVIVSFHELEDRIVKQFFIKNSDPKCATSKYKAQNTNPIMPFRLISRKSIKPSREEVLSNPRARSAKLRVAEKVREIYV